MSQVSDVSDASWALSTAAAEATVAAARAQGRCFTGLVQRLRPPRLTAALERGWTSAPRRSSRS